MYKKVDAGDFYRIKVQPRGDIDFVMSGIYDPVTLECRYSVYPVIHLEGGSVVLLDSICNKKFSADNVKDAERKMQYRIDEYGSVEETGDLCFYRWKNKPVATVLIDDETNTCDIIKTDGTESKTLVSVRFKKKGISGDKRPGWYRVVVTSKEDGTIVTKPTIFMAPGVTFATTGMFKDEETTIRRNY